MICSIESKDIMRLVDQINESIYGVIIMENGGNQC